MTALATAHRTVACTPCGWEELSREEQCRQLRELMASSYWMVLPPEIRKRFLDLYHHS